MGITTADVSSSNSSHMISKVESGEISYRLPTRLVVDVDWITDRNGFLSVHVSCVCADSRNDERMVALLYPFFLFDWFLSFVLFTCTP